MSPSGVCLPASLRKASWKWLKFGRSGTSFIRHLTRAAKACAAARRSGQARLDLAADLEQHADQMRDVAARVVDVGLQQHRVARGLVDLDVVVVGQQPLELGAVEARGAADQRHAGRVEAELVLVHALRASRPRSTPGARKSAKPLPRYSAGTISSAPSTWKYFEISGCELTSRRISRAISIAFMHQPVALELHLPPRDVEAGDQLLVGAGRGVGEDRLVELGLDLAEVDVLDQQHRALAQRGHRLVRRVGLVDAQPDLARIGDEPRASSFSCEGLSPSSACCVS